MWNAVLCCVSHETNTQKLFCCCCICLYLTVTPALRTSQRFAIVLPYVKPPAAVHRSPHSHDRPCYSVFKVLAGLPPCTALLASSLLALAILYPIGNRALACYPARLGNGLPLPLSAVPIVNDKRRNVQTFFFEHVKTAIPCAATICGFLPLKIFQKRPSGYEIFVEVAQNTRGSVCRGRTPVRLSWTPPCRYTC